MLNDEITSLREKLNNQIKITGFVNDEILTISRQLDDLILQYYNNIQVKSKKALNNKFVLKSHR